MQKGIEDSFDSELKTLAENQKRDFFRILVDVLNDRAWCLEHNITYYNPNARRAGHSLILELKEFKYFEQTTS